MEGVMEQFQIFPGKDPDRFVIGGRMPASLLEQLEQSRHSHPPDITVSFEAEPPAMPDFPHVLKVDGKPYYFRMEEEQNHELYRQQAGAWTRDGSIVRKMFFYQDITSLDRQKYQEEKVKADKRQSSRKSQTLSVSQEIQLEAAHRKGHKGRPGGKHVPLVAPFPSPAARPGTVGVSSLNAVRRSPRVSPSDPIAPIARPQSAPVAPTSHPVSTPFSLARPRPALASESASSAASVPSGWSSDSSDSKGDRASAGKTRGAGSSSNGTNGSSERRSKSKTTNLTGKSLMLHVIHRLAAAPQARPKLDLYAKNPKEVGELLPRIAALKGTVWELKPEFFREVDADWPHYSDTDRLRVRSRLSQNLEHIPSVELRDLPQPSPPSETAPPVPAPPADVSYLFEDDDPETAPSPGGPSQLTPPEPPLSAATPELPAAAVAEPTESAAASGKSKGSSTADESSGAEPPTPYAPPRVTRQGSKDFTGRAPPKGTAAANQPAKEVAPAAPAAGVGKSGKAEAASASEAEFRRVLRSSVGLPSAENGIKRRPDESKASEHGGVSKAQKTSADKTDVRQQQRRDEYRRLKVEYDETYPNYRRLYDEVESIRRLFAKLKDDRKSGATRDVDRRILAAYKEHHQAFVEKSEQLRVAKERVKELKDGIHELLKPAR